MTTAEAIATISRRLRKDAELLWAAVPAVLLVELLFFSLRFGVESLSSLWVLGGSAFSGGLVAALAVLLRRRIDEWIGFLQAVQGRVVRVGSRRRWIVLVFDNRLVVRQLIANPFGNLIGVWRFFDASGAALLPGASEAARWTRVPAPWKPANLGAVAPFRHVGLWVERLRAIGEGLRVRSLRLDAYYLDLTRSSGTAQTGIAVMCTVNTFGRSVMGESWLRQLDAIASLFEDARRRFAMEKAASH